MVQDCVPDRAGAGQGAVRGVPAEHYEVGAGRQASQGPSRVRVHDVVADLW